MNGDNMFKEMLEMLFLCMVFIGVLGLTYFVTRKIGGFSKQMNVNKNMKIIEILPLMQGQYLYIVKIGKGYHLMGCAQKGSITYLKELDTNEIDLEEIKSRSFQEYFGDMMKGGQKAKDEK